MTDRPRVSASVTSRCKSGSVTKRTTEVLRRCAVSWGTVYGIARLDALHQIPADVPSNRAQLLHEAIDTV